MELNGSSFDEAECAIRQACEDGNYGYATTLLIERFGPQIRRFIASRVAGPVSAAEVFSDFSLDVWRGLPGFGWRCPVRAWAFTLARNASNRYVTAPVRRATRNIPLSDVTVAEPFVDPTEDTEPTPRHLCSTTKQRVRALRATLSHEEQQLLALRVDAGMRWRDLTLALEGDIEDPATLKRVTARMRKRFQLAKEKLRDAVIRDGLLAA